MLSRSNKLPIDPAAGAAAFVLRVALAILLLGAPIASVATRQAVYAIVPVGAALTLIAWLLEPDTRGPRRLRAALASPAGLGALFLFGWTVLSLFWTPFAVGPTERFVKTAATVGLVGLAVAFLPERTKTSNLYLLPIGAMAGALALIAAAFAGWNPPTPFRELSVLDRAALGLTLLFWPGVAGFAIREKHWLAIGLTFLTVCAAFAVRTPIAAVALAVSAATFLIARRAPARVATQLAVAWGVVIGLAPLLALALSYVASPARLPAVSDPLIVWGEIVAKDGLRTLIGHGFDSGARAVAAGYLPLSAPHSFLFELWFELGIVGVGGAIFAIFCLFQVAGSAPEPVAPLLLAGLTSALFASAFGVGVAPIWWVTFLALDALAFALVLRGQFRGRRPSVGDISNARIPASALPKRSE